MQEQSQNCEIQSIVEKKGQYCEIKSLLSFLFFIAWQNTPNTFISRRRLTIAGSWVTRKYAFCSCIQALVVTIQLCI